MAYATTITRTESMLGGRRCWVIVVTETGVTAASDEWSVDNLPPLATVTALNCVLTAGDGTATTVDPQLGEAANTNTVFENTAAAATVRNRTLDARAFLTGRTLYGRSKADGNTGTTGNIVTTIAVVEGHF